MAQTHRPDVLEAGLSSRAVCLQWDPGSPCPRFTVLHQEAPHPLLSLLSCPVTVTSVTMGFLAVTLLMSSLGTEAPSRCGPSVPFYIVFATVSCIVRHAVAQSDLELMTSLPPKNQDGR